MRESVAKQKAVAKQKKKVREVPQASAAAEAASQSSDEEDRPGKADPFPPLPSSICTMRGQQTGTCTEAALLQAALQVLREVAMAQLGTRINLKASGHRASGRRSAPPASSLMDRLPLSVQLR